MNKFIDITDVVSVIGAMATVAGALTLSIPLVGVGIVAYAVGQVYKPSKLDEVAREIAQQPESIPAAVVTTAYFVAAMGVMVSTIPTVTSVGMVVAVATSVLAVLHVVVWWYRALAPSP